MYAAQCADDPLWNKEWVEGNGEMTIKRRSKPEDIKLYSLWLCPFAQRVWIALEEKGLPYQYIETNLYEVDVNEPGGYSGKALSLEEKKLQFPELMRISPRGLVPAISDAGDELWDSVPIVEYFGEKYHNVGINYMPATPFARAQCKVWTSNIISDKIIQHFYRMLFNPNVEEQEKSKEIILNGFRELGNHMHSKGPYILEDFSTIDINLIPFWQRLITVGKHHRNFEFPTDESVFVRWQQWWHAVSNRPGVANTIVCPDRLISWYTGYANFKGSGDIVSKTK